MTKVYLVPARTYWAGMSLFLLNGVLLLVAAFGEY